MGSLCQARCSLDLNCRQFAPPDPFAFPQLTKHPMQRFPPFLPFHLICPSPSPSPLSVVRDALCFMLAAARPIISWDALALSSALS